jgi:ribonuclease HII
MVLDPTLDVEAAMHADGARFVIGCDEVGRGAIAGPVGVGMCVVDCTMGAFPAGLRDSKMLSEKRREELAPLAAGWALFSSVGLASPLEVDEIGLSAALGLAGKRALLRLRRAGVRMRESIVLLDGSFDWLNPALSSRVRVQTRVRADQDCASVSAASVVAKVHRDRIMIKADGGTPGYSWASNKGYGSVEHFAAIAELGATDFHRRSWLRDPELIAELASDVPLELVERALGNSA